MTKIEKIPKKLSEFTFSNYSNIANTTRVYGAGTKLIYPTLGLTGEAGEVAEKVKKILRDNNGIVTEENKQDLAKELGDVLWYINAICFDLELKLEDIANMNIEKLMSRVKRNVLHGKGDNR